MIMMDTKITTIESEDFFNWVGDKRSRAAGTGLVALDILISSNNKTRETIWAGGSCGNVLTILAFLGWQSYPIARLAHDSAAKEIRQDMKRWNVSIDFVKSVDTGSTPVILERIKRREGAPPRHVFEWRCPHCSSWFPSYKPIKIAAVRGIIDALQKANVFYFDRAAPGPIQLANEYREAGSLVMFEPNSVSDQRLFKRALSSCHIVKYSHERIGNRNEQTMAEGPPIQIETLGEEGLRFRFKNSNWRTMEAAEPETFSDGAGAGDWCSAGILHILGKEGWKGLTNLNRVALENALRFGQALAAVNCMFEGPRGTMYSLLFDQFKNTTFDVLKSMKLRSKIWKSSYSEGIQVSQSPISSFCHHCKIDE